MMIYKVGHFYKRMYYIKDDIPDGTIIFKVITLGKPFIRVDVVYADNDSLMSCHVQEVRCNFPQSKTIEVDESLVLAKALQDVNGMSYNYITKEQIRNLVEYCLNDVLDRNNFRVRELVSQLNNEFKKAKEYYKKVYKDGE